MDRSAIMRSVKSRDTAPERTVTQLINAAGYRVRRSKWKLPGSPDIVFFKRRLAIFVHGCFWHGHDCKRGARIPRKNRNYWKAKIERNRKRDIKVRRQLRSAGWNVLTIWECRLKHEAQLRRRLLRFLIK